MGAGDIAGRGAAAIDRYLPSTSGLQQTSCTPVLLSIDGTDGLTEGRIACRYIDARRQQRAASISHWLRLIEKIT